MILPILKVTGFILWINLLPPITSLIFGNRWQQPVDGGILWLDGRPLFGSHKTIRGIVVGFLGGLAAAPVLGIPWWVGGAAALLAMAGDLLSSFIKRRPDVPSGSPVVVLDQIFECLFPALFLAHFLILSWREALLVPLMFIPLAYCGSRLWNYFIYRPPKKNYASIVRSTIRFREWRARHTPLARWLVLMNFNSFLANRVLVPSLFKLLGLYEIGRQNALNLKLKEQAFYFPDLPEEFDGFRILLMTDLHLDGLEELTARIIREIQGIEADLCLIGGDFRMRTHGPTAPCLRHLRNLTGHVRAKHGLLGVLGNHDCIEMAPDLEEAGILMLINDSWKIAGAKADLWIVGIDDPHYYKVHDPGRAFAKVPPEDFKIFLAHSPEAYREAREYHPQLYLCGHTHGGQIRLPGGLPLYTNSRAPRFTADGPWHYRGMQGYTSRGAGASGTPLRFNCPGEILLLTLRRGGQAGGVPEKS